MRIFSKTEATKIASIKK